MGEKIDTYFESSLGLEMFSLKYEFNFSNIERLTKGFHYL